MAVVVPFLSQVADLIQLRPGPLHGGLEDSWVPAEPSSLPHGATKPRKGGDLLGGGHADVTMANASCLSFINGRCLGSRRGNAQSSRVDRASRLLHQGGLPQKLGRREQA